MDRYTDSSTTRTTTMPHRNGTQVSVVLRKPQFRTQQNFVSYTVSAADRMWTLAERHYGNTLDWWVIADLNPAVVCPDDLFWGMKIAVPVA